MALKLTVNDKLHVVERQAEKNFFLEGHIHATHGQGSRQARPDFQAALIGRLIVPLVARMLMFMLT